MSEEAIINYHGVFASISPLRYEHETISTWPPARERVVTSNRVKNPRTLFTVECTVRYSTVAHDGTVIVRQSYNHTTASAGGTGIIAAYGCQRNPFPAVTKQ